MSIIDRKIKHREEVRAAIVEAARDLVLEDGWQALSIRKIAEAIQYSVPVIYDHFINKEALLQEFVRQGFALLNMELKKASESAEKPEQKIKKIALAYWEFANNNKSYYQLMYGLGMPSCETVKEIPELNEFTQLVIGPIQQLLHHSRQQNVDPVKKFKHFWSGLHGLIALEMINIITEENKNEEVLEDFIQTFLSRLENTQN